MSDQIFRLEGPVFLLALCECELLLCTSPVKSHLIARKVSLSEKRACERAATHYASPSVSPHLSEAASCNHIWLKREQSARCETWLFNVILIHQREDGKGLRDGGEKRKTWAQRCYQEGNKRAIRLCSLDTRREEGGFFPDPLKICIGQTWQWPEYAM